MHRTLYLYERIVTFLNVSLSFLEFKVFWVLRVENMTVHDVFYKILSVWLWLAGIDPYLPTKESRNTWETTVAADIMTPQLRVMPFTFLPSRVTKFWVVWLVHFCTMQIFSFAAVNSPSATINILCLESWSTPARSKGQHQDWLPCFFQLHHEDDLRWRLHLPDISGAGLWGPQLSGVEL